MFNYTIVQFSVYENPALFGRWDAHPRVALLMA